VSTRSPSSAERSAIGAVADDPGGVTDAGSVYLYRRNYDDDD